MSNIKVQCSGCEKWIRLEYEKARTMIESTSCLCPKCAKEKDDTRITNGADMEITIKIEKCEPYMVDEVEKDLREVLALQLEGDWFRSYSIPMIRIGKEASDE